MDSLIVLLSETKSARGHENSKGASYCEAFKGGHGSVQVRSVGVLFLKETEKFST